MSGENIQKDPLALRTKYPSDSLLQVDAILVVACRSLACRSLVNRALLSLGNVTDAETIKNDSLVITATLTDFLWQDASLYGRYGSSRIKFVIFDSCGRLSNRAERKEKGGSPVITYTCPK